MRLAAAFLPLLASCSGPTTWVLVDSSVTDAHLEIPEARVRAFGDGFLSDALRDVDAKVERVIVVSDGDTDEGAVREAVDRLAEKGVIVSVIAVGVTPKTDIAVMSRVAERGRGRFLFTHRASNVSSLIADELRRPR